MPNTPPEVLAELDRLREKRERVFSRLQNIYEASRSINADNVRLFEPRLNKLSYLEEAFEAIQDNISSYNARTALPAERLDVLQTQNAFDNMVFDVKGKFFNLMRALAPANQNAVPNTAAPSSPSLPDIAIPKFGGKIEEWSNFISLFSSIVHKNSSLSGSEKFVYLRSLLHSDALAVISGFELTSDNYQLAIDALYSRYQNKRRLATHYFSQIKTFPALTSNNLCGLQHFLNVHSNSVNALKALNLVDLADFLLFQLAAENLDASTRKNFESKQPSNTIPSYQQLIDFVTEQCRTFEVLSGETTSNKPKIKAPLRHSNSFILKTKESSHEENAARIPPCPLCQRQHALLRCDKFLSQGLSEKYETIKKLKRCFNCLGNHLRSACSSRSTCRTCHSSRHHTLLHSDQSSTTPSVENPQANALSCASSVPNPCHQVLLGTLQALIDDNEGNYRPIRAVLDPGSQISAITSTAVRQLGLKRSKSHVDIFGISNSHTKALGIVDCTIRPRFSTDTILTLKAVVLSSITSQLPSAPLSSSLRHQFAGLTLADESFDQPSNIDLLLGSDIYSQILSTDSPHIIQGHPSALNTLFGWVIIGSTAPKEAPFSPISLLVGSPSLDSLLRQFWEQEEVAKPIILSPEDKLCEEHFLNTHYRDSSGRYVVSLPFKEDATPLATNRHTALRSYFNLENRLSKSQANTSQYQNFLTEYEDLQHMNVTAKHSTYILPHHCVFKQTSSSHKIRVVFNGSAPDSSGISLNDRLLTGTKLQAGLPDILTAFRFHEVAICADIRMMYRQILLKPEDRQYQHIFWRPQPDSPVTEYELNTVTYGLTPSAYLAQRVLQQLVLDEGHQFPMASKALRAHTYVDDVVTGASSLEEAETLISELNHLLAKGGFELRKWCSNEPAALQSVPSPHLEKPIIFSTEDSAFKILGLMWEPKSDAFTYHTQPFRGPFTKRAVLSYLSQNFDPLGWLTPVIFFMKHFLQQLWLLKYNWDDQLCEANQIQWKQFSEEISLLEKIKIPRKFPVSYSEVRLVGFCDGSSKGFAACFYLCFSLESSVYSTLLTAKSKVAPLKIISIPRLELCGALLLSKLFSSLYVSLSHLHLNEILLYTDAQIVLSWLRTPPHLLKTFVAHRIVNILELTSLNMWHHIASENNPADYGSRGMTPLQFHQHLPQWLHGPVFLKSPSSTWPRDLGNFTKIEEIPELRNTNHILTIQAKNEDTVESAIRKYSSLSRLQRVFAYIRRFIHNSRSAKKLNGTLSTSEINDAMKSLVWVTQQEHFAKELKDVKNTRLTSSTLNKLSPFLDHSGCLRVGGRLRFSKLEYDSKHQLLLPQKSHLSTLICEHYHLLSLHAGPRTVQALIAQKFWIIGLRSLLRQRIHRCLTCHKFRAIRPQPVMADLPPCRTRLIRAFLQVGTDFAGPFLTKESHRRKAPISKGYLCVFVCMATKSLHLEYTSDLSTNAFLASLDRFVARRGLPQDIYSDCGRNYVGAANYFKDIRNFLQNHDQEISEFCTKRQINWHFNPPMAPNFGGIWEAAVKSAKNLFTRLVGDTPHTFEEYTTLFSRIEAVLNSRPLCSMSFDPSENVDYLSPGHFLIGSPLLSPPEHNLPETLNFRCRWQRLRQLFQQFWRRFSREYLHTQTQREKWRRCGSDVKEGDVCFMYGVDTSPLKWPIGRVQKLLPGIDGITRVVQIRTPFGQYIRPVNKLVLLPPQ